MLGTIIAIAILGIAGYIFLSIVDVMIDTISSLLERRK